MTPDEMHDLMRFKQGRTAPEPKVPMGLSRPRGKLHCTCGDSFTEFNRWQAHVRVCPDIQRED